MGLVFMLVVFATPCAALVLTFLVFSDGAKAAGRWGTRREGVVVGDSPYRTAEATEHLQRYAPIWLRFVSWITAMGGVATVGLLAPAGLLLILVSMEQNPGFATFLVFLVSASGFPAGVVLIRLARQVVRHERVEPFVFRYLYVHHACVAGTMLLVDGSGRLHVSPVSIAICVVLVSAVATLHGVAKLVPASEPDSGESVLHS